MEDILTIGEEAAGIGVFSYTCPDCSWRENHERWLQREAEEERRQFDNHGLGIRNN